MEKDVSLKKVGRKKACTGVEGFQGIGWRRRTDIVIVQYHEMVM